MNRLEELSGANVCNFEKLWNLVLEYDWKCEAGDTIKVEWIAGEFI